MRFRLCVPVSQKQLSADWERGRVSIGSHVPSEPAQLIAWSRQAFPYLSPECDSSKARVRFWSNPSQQLSPNNSLFPSEMKETIRTVKVRKFVD